MKKTILLLAAMVAMSVLPAKAWDNMYVIGNATGSWDLNNAKPMNKISECEFELTLYLWCTNDNDGFKFLTAKDSWASVYAPNSDNWQIERNWIIEDLSYNEGISDHNFGVKADGWYTLHINTAVEYTDEESGETKTKVVLSTWPMELYPVGGGCEVGWSTSGDVAFKETAFASGIYQGSLELKVSDTNGTNDDKEQDHRRIKFLTQKEYGPHFGPANPTDFNWDISGYGVFATKFYTENDQKFFVLDEAVGKYNMTLDANTGKLYIVPQEISIKAQIEMGALEEMDIVNCHVWTELVPGEAKDIADIVPTEDGWFEAKVTGVYGPINFLYYGKDWNVQTPDMKNDENGYYTDKSCTVYAEKREDGKLTCYHNDDNTLLNQTITLEFKVAQDTTWVAENTMYLYEWQKQLNSEGVYDKSNIRAAGVADGSIYTFKDIPVVNQVKFVLQTVGEGWNPLTVETSTYKSQKYWISKENGAYKLIATDNFDEDPTTLVVGQISVINDNIVYDIMGRALGTSVENLPQGIYVRNGKKFVVAQ